MYILENCILPFSSGSAGSSTHKRNIRVAQIALHCVWNHCSSLDEVLPASFGMGLLVNTSRRSEKTAL